MNSRPQDDVPYEVIVKHIIEDYRRLEKANEQLAKYARSLEKKIDDLQQSLAKKALTNQRQGERNVELNRKNKRVEAYVKYLQDLLSKENVSYGDMP